MRKQEAEVRGSQAMWMGLRAIWLLQCPGLPTCGNISLLLWTSRICYFRMVQGNIQDEILRTTLWATECIRSWNFLNKNQRVGRDLGYHLVQFLTHESPLSKFITWAHSALMWIPPMLRNSLSLKSAYHIFLEGVLSTKSWLVFLQFAHFASFFPSSLNYSWFVWYSSIGRLFQDETTDTMPHLWVFFSKLNILSSFIGF